MTRESGRGIRDRRRLWITWLAMLLVINSLALAQAPARPEGGRNGAAQGPAAAQGNAATSTDPLDRETPFGTITGFTKAAHREEFAIASRFLQPGNRSEEASERLARDLNDLLDRYYTKPLAMLSTSPGGSLDDGLPPDREKITLEIGDEKVDIFLNRVKEPTSGQMIWVFASDSLARVPTLARSRQATFAERVMPPEMVERSFLGVSLAQWLLWVASIVLPFLGFWIGAWVVQISGGGLIRNAARRAFFLSWWRGVRWLVVIGLTLFAHGVAIQWLGFSLSVRYEYNRLVLIVAVVMALVVAWRVVSLLLGHARQVATQHGRADTRSLILLGERVIKVTLVLVAVFVVLTLSGVNLTTALAGVGIAGVAVALGAQKSVENLLGAVFLLTDKALAVGDYCRLSGYEGWIEDVTLRSVRLRTLQQTLLSIPAGALSQGSIENFTTRRKILVQNTLRLRYDTSVDQLQEILAGIRQALLRHPNVEPESARVRIVDLGTQAIELELFGYVLTADWAKFLEVREQLLLQAATIVEAAGSAFAAPTQLVYLPGSAPDRSSEHPPASTTPH